MSISIKNQLLNAIHNDNAEIDGIHAMWYLNQFIEKYLSYGREVMGPEEVNRFADGTGFFNKLVHLNLEQPAMVFLDKENRYGVILKTRFGNVVFFKRYTEVNNTVIVCNGPTTIMGFLNLRCQVTADHLVEWLPTILPSGAYHDGIDNRIESFVEAAMVVEEQAAM